MLKPINRSYRSLNLAVRVDNEEFIAYNVRCIVYESERVGRMLNAVIDEKLVSARGEYYTLYFADADEAPVHLPADRTELEFI